MNNVSNFFRKVFICLNDVATYVPTTVLKGWLLNYCSICAFHQGKSSIFSLGVQQKTIARWTYFSSRSYFWVNFWNLSLLMYFLLLPYEQQTYSSKVLNVSSSSVTWLHPILIVKFWKFWLHTGFLSRSNFSLLKNENVQSHPVNEWKPIIAECCSLSTFWSQSFF